MQAPEFYRGREQTYVKHFFLEKYLERVAYNILSFRNEFVYVDGFSGPWKSDDEDFQDTSFMIAINQLRQIKKGMKEGRDKDVQMRCYFNDNNPVAFQGLKAAVNTIDDIEIRVACKEFEEAVSDIADFIGRSFSLTFIDPTGWTGFGLQKIQPILQKRGEVIINFMFDFVSRFLEDQRPSTARSFDPVFGGAGWNDEVERLVAAGASREDAILEVYRDRLRLSGAFPHITSTRILKPLSDRSFFHLVYGTRHWKGLLEFRNVEKQTVSEQERVRQDAKATKQVERTGQNDLFASTGSQTGPLSFEFERAKQLDLGEKMLRSVLTKHKSVKYEEILAQLLELPLVWDSDVKAWLSGMRKNGEIEIPQLRLRERVPKIGYRINWLGSLTD